MQDNNGLEEWVEPAVDTLEVEGTHLQPGSGADGGVFPDCTKS